MGWEMDCKRGVKGGRVATSHSGLTGDDTDGPWTDCRRERREFISVTDCG